MAQEVFEIRWRDTRIEIRYDPSFIAGRPHVEFQILDGPMVPLTSTGYRSLFTTADEIEATGGAVAYVRCLLEIARDLGVEAAEAWRFAPVPIPDRPLGRGKPRCSVQDVGAQLELFSSASASSTPSSWAPGALGSFSATAGPADSSLG